MSAAVAMCEHQDDQSPGDDLGRPLPGMWTSHQKDSRVKLLKADSVSSPGARNSGRRQEPELVPIDRLDEEQKRLKRQRQHYHDSQRTRDVAGALAIRDVPGGRVVVVGPYRRPTRARRAECHEPLRCVENSQALPPGMKHLLQYWMSSALGIGETTGVLVLRHRTPFEGRDGLEWAVRRPKMSRPSRRPYAPLRSSRNALVAPLPEGFLEVAAGRYRSLAGRVPRARISL